MAAKIKILQTKDTQIKQEQLEQLQTMFGLFPELEDRDCSPLIWKIKRKNRLNAPNTWTFIMISPEQNRTVVNWLDEKSTQPRKALRLWALLFEYVHRETGQIMLSRQEIAEKIKMRSNDVSRIMSELESINAILKKKDGRGVIYYMNPNVANHYPQEIRENAQKETPKLKLLDGGLD